VLCNGSCVGKYLARRLRIATLDDVVGQLSIWRQRDLVTMLGVGLASGGVAAFGVDALTDRDWTLSGWEWPEVLVAAVIVTLITLRAVALAIPAIAIGERSSSLRLLVKTSLERRGYRVGRLPPLASEPGYALELDFDYILAHCLERRIDTRPFFFVQIGAFDGTTHDRLHEHVRKGRWHGVLVEPQSRYFERLAESYAGTDGLSFVNAAVDRKRGSRMLYRVEKADGDPIEGLAHLASFSREHLLDWQRRDGERAESEIRIGGTPVRCLTFDDLLADVDYIDLLHIDAEGHDFELLKLFDFDRFAPEIVRFEHVHLSRDDWDEAVRLLASHGYRAVREEYDTTAYRGS
jgi:FkbM family methyltransferase